MSEAHHELSPSKFPAWAVCPCFESDPTERADATQGTAQHAALAEALGGNEGPLASLPTEAREAVSWAADYIRTLAGEAKIATETRVEYSAPDTFARSGQSVIYFGTADALILRGNLADLIDYKSGGDEREHRAQLAGYALALFSMRARLKTIRCHVLYGRVRHVDSWSLTQAEAAGTVLPILEARNDPARKPVPCDYCTMCGHRMTCPALAERVEAVATANAWELPGEALREPAAITEPETMSKALTLARFVGTWADAVRKAATELAKGGADLPGYRLQERRRGREVDDLSAALDRTGLTPAQFVGACKLSLPKLTDAFAASRGLSKAQAGRELESLLSDLIRQEPPTQSLVANRKERA